MQSKIIAADAGGTGIFKNAADHGYVNVTELRVLANAARNRNIPFINVNFPNDGGVTNNPEFVILNTTLHAHCEAIYKFIQRNWATSNIFYLRKAGARRDRLRNDFAEIEKNTASVPLKMKYINVDNNVDISKYCFRIWTVI